MHETSPPLTDADARIVAALTEGGGRAVPLRNLVHDHDWLHRAVPTFDELSFGLPRLVAAGWASVRTSNAGELRFEASPAAMRLRQSATGDPVRAIAEAIGAARRPDEDRSLGRLPGLRPEALTDAVAAHGSWIERWSRPLTFLARRLAGGRPVGADRAMRGDPGMTGTADGFPRSLSRREAEILDLMLGVDDPRIEPLRDQRASVVVAGLCGCGCASIHLAVDRERSRPAPVCRQPISAAPKPNLPAREQNCGVDLFLDDGFLSSLEICWIDTPPPEFPPATSFEAPELMCERHEAALAELLREPSAGGQPHQRDSAARFMPSASRVM